MKAMTLWQIDTYAYDDEWVYNDKFHLLDFVGQAENADEAAERIAEKLRFLDVILNCETEVVPCTLGYEMVRKDDGCPLLLLEIH